MMRKPLMCFVLFQSQHYVDSVAFDERNAVCSGQSSHIGDTP